MIQLTIKPLSGGDSFEIDIESNATLLHLKNHLLLLKR